MKIHHLLVGLLLYLCTSCEEKASSSQVSGQQQTILRDSNLLAKQNANPYVPVDISPMDMLYYPQDYPIKKMNGEAAAMPVMRIIYSRPHRGGRQLFGHLVQWGQPWRLGANEATEIEFFQPVNVGDKPVEKGRYILYAIPYEDRWTVVLNRDVYSWGLKLNPADDVARVDIPVRAISTQVEHFTMDFKKAPTGTQLLMAWENTEALLPISW